MSALGLSLSMLLPAIIKLTTKILLQQYVGVDTVADVLSNITERGIDNRPNGRDKKVKYSEIVENAKNIANKLQPIFQEARLEPNEKEALLDELALTLQKTNIDIELLFDLDLRPELLDRLLREIRIQEIKQLSTDTSDVYYRLLKEMAEECINAAIKFPDYEITRDRRMIHDHTEIKKDLQRISQHNTEGHNKTHDGVQQLLNLQKLADEKTSAFEKDYLDAIVYKLNKVSTFDVEILEDFSTNRILDKIYIHPRLKRKKQTEYSTAQRKNSNEKEHKIETIEEILHRERRIVFGGEAGIGKTTLLHWLAITIANHQCNGNLSSWNNKIPFYISLRTVKGLDFPTPEKYIAQIDPDLEHLQPSNWVEQQLKSGRAILLIDGLDELAYEYRTKILDRIESLIYKYPDTRYIMTSRPLVIDQKGRGKWNKWLEQTKFIEFDILEMERTEVEAFIEHWYQIVSPKEQAEVQVSSEHLKKLLWQRNDLYHLATTPLLCSMICALHYELKHQLPTGRLKLYDECIELMLKLRDDTVSLSSAQKRSLLQVLAFRMQRNGESELDRKLVEHIFANELPRLGHVSQEASAVLDYFVQKSGLLREPVLGKIEFIHRTFQDFFAAKEIVEEQEFKFLLQQASNSFWRETFPLVAGSMKDHPADLTYLLEQLIQDDRPIEQRTIALACLETATNIDDDLIKRIFASVDEMFPPYRQEHQKILASVGEAVIPYLVCGHQPNIAAMIVCINVLAQIGGDEALAALETYTDIEDKDVQFAIDGAWPYFDTELFARKFLQQRAELRVTEPHLLLYLQYLPNLKGLILFGLKFRDISTLSGLQNLRELELSGTQISDLSALSGLQNLRELELSGTQISDLSALSDLQNLQQLGLSESQISDLSALSDLHNLQQLDLSSTEVSDLSGLNSLQNLRQLELRGTQVSDLIGLSSLQNLRQLDLSHTQVSDLSALSGLQNLQQLDLSYTEVSDLSALSGLQNLRELDLSGLRVRDLSVLSGLQHLQQLDLSGTPVIDLSVLSGLQHLQQLDLSGTPVIDLSVLSGLQHLQQLDLSGTPVMDLSVLSGLQHLQQLDLSRTQIRELNILSSLQYLQQIDLSETQVCELNILSSLQYLQQIDLSETQVRELSALSGLSNLRRLYLLRIEVSNLNLLGDLQNLEFLCLSNTQLQDLSPLRDLPKLKRVWIN
jgi:Leucine-rich repeat (LRR) protein